jgi:hypothetical protein
MKRAQTVSGFFTGGQKTFIFERQNERSFLAKTLFQGTDRDGTGNFNFFLIFSALTNFPDDEKALHSGFILFYSQ